MKDVARQKHHSFHIIENQNLKLKIPHRDAIHIPIFNSRTDTQNPSSINFKNLYRREILTTNYKSYLLKGRLVRKN